MQGAGKVVVPVTSVCFVQDREDEELAIVEEVDEKYMTAARRFNWLEAFHEVSLI